MGEVRDPVAPPRHGCGELPCETFGSGHAATLSPFGRAYVVASAAGCSVGDGSAVVPVSSGGARSEVVERLCSYVWAGSSSSLMKAGFPGGHDRPTTAGAG